MFELNLYFVHFKDILVEHYWKIPVDWLTAMLNALHVLQANPLSHLLNGMHANEIDYLSFTDDDDDVDDHFTSHLHLSTIPAFIFLLGNTNIFYNIFALFI